MFTVCNRKKLSIFFVNPVFYHNGLEMTEKSALQSNTFQVLDFLDFFLRLKRNHYLVNEFRHLKKAQI